MENQHRKIKGYRELSQAEIDLMNEIKTKGAELGGLVEKLRGHLKDHRLKVSKDLVGEELVAEVDRLEAATPERWVSVGATHLQEGLMALTRSVAQPTFF